MGLFPLYLKIKLINHALVQKVLCIDNVVVVFVVFLVCSIFVFVVF